MSLFRKRLTSFLEDANYEGNEWILNEILSENNSEISSDIAHKEIEFVISLFDNNYKEESFLDLLDILYMLVRKSNTTELSEDLIFKLKQFLSHSCLQSDYAKSVLKDVYKWYRI